MKARWQTKTLDECCEVLTEGAPSKMNRAYLESALVRRFRTRVTGWCQDRGARNQPSVIPLSTTKYKTTPAVRPEPVEGRNMTGGRPMGHDAYEEKQIQAIRAVPVHPSIIRQAHDSGRTEVEVEK
jgi:hypothetical protein